MQVIVIPDFLDPVSIPFGWVIAVTVILAFMTLELIRLELISIWGIRVAILGGQSLESEYLKNKERRKQAKAQGDEPK
jgi:hypothetical protein